MKPQHIMLVDIIKSSVSKARNRGDREVIIALNKEQIRRYNIIHRHILKKLIGCKIRKEHNLLLIKWS